MWRAHLRVREASEDDVRSTEEQLGVVLPSALRQLLVRHQGMSADGGSVTDTLGQRIGVGYLFFFTEAEGGQKNIRDLCLSLRRRGYPDSLVPFAAAGGQAHLALDFSVSRTCPSVSYVHPDGDRPETGHWSTRPVCEDVESFLRALATDPMRGLTRLPRSPIDQTFWEGVWEIETSGASLRVPYFVCCPRDRMPTAGQLALRDRTRDGFVERLRDARRGLLEAMRASPGEHALTAADVERITNATVDDAPFDGPEVTLYDDDAWSLRFSQTSLAGCALLGVGVDFVGQTVVRCHRLDLDAEIESSEAGG